MLSPAVMIVTLLLQQATNRSPSAAASVTATADTLHFQGKFDAAMTMYRDALAIDPGYVRARRGLGRSLDKTGRHAEAQAVYLAGISTTDQTSWNVLLLDLATSYAFDRRFDEAKAALQRFVDFSVTTHGRGEDYSVMLFDLAMARGAFDDAARVLDERHAPVEKPAPLVPSATLDQRGLVPRLRWMEYNAGRAVVAARAGQTADARRFMAEADGQARNIEEALAAYTAATGEDTGGLKPRNLLAPSAAEVAYCLGDAAGAIRLLADRPDKSSRENLILGQALEREGNLGEARAAYTRVLESPDFSFQIAWAWPIAKERLAAIGR